MNPPIRDPSGVPAVYFDGRTTRRHEVTLDIADGRVNVAGGGITRSDVLDAVEISPELGSAPRFVRFGDGAFCQVDDHAALERLLVAAGRGSDGVARWQRNRWWVAAALVVSVLLVVSGYKVGLPTIAKIVADRLPPAALEQIGSHVIEILDRSVLQPSALPTAVQDRIVLRFFQLELPTPVTVRTILFRKSAALGANAVALPSGQVVVTDDLINLARTDEEVIAVLAHEAGHVHRRHALRAVLQQSAVALLVTWYLGDLSPVVAAAPTALLQAKYSRDFEREADAFAADLLRRNHIPPGTLVDLLERLETSPASEPARANYLSSHPATAERLRAIRGR